VNMSFYDSKSSVLCAHFEQDGWSALHWACSNNSVATAEKLIRNGADVNLQDRVSIDGIFAGMKLCENQRW
jgi:hypothetical protein